MTPFGASPLHCYITHDHFFSGTKRLRSIIFRISGSGIEEGVPVCILILQ